MKRFYFIILLMLFSLFLSSCNDKKDEIPTIPDKTIEDVETPKEEIYYSNPFTPLDYNLASISLDKEFYEITDTINVEIKGANNNDYVGIFDYNKEPDNGVPHKRLKVATNTNLSFSISDLELSPGEYCACLYNNKTSYLFDRVEFEIDNDNSDYKINNAKINYTIEGKKTKFSITIYPSDKSKLTYVLYYAKDGKRLTEYTDLARVSKENVNDFTIEFNENIYIPDEVNQIEVYIPEGRSSSYFIDISNELKLKQSRYKYNFQVLSDIHANPQYGYWSSHFFNALNDIKCLSGNTSGIFTVGDNTDMGSVDHYAHLFKILKEVFKDNIPSIYYTVGNHDYMYFSESIGGFDAGIDYFKDATGMENSYYSIDVNDHKYIFLSSDEKTTQGAIYEDQMNWLKEELTKIDKSEFAYIFVHQPFYNTTSGSLPNQNWNGMNNVAEQIKELLKDYPNVVVFTGHTHYSLECYRSTYFGHGLNANYVNNASVAYLMDDEYEYTVGGMCNFIEVYEDYIIIKGRDLFERRWVSNALYVCYLY